MKSLESFRRTEHMLPHAPHLLPTLAKIYTKPGVEVILYYCSSLTPSPLVSSSSLQFTPFVTVSLCYSTLGDFWFPSTADKTLTTCKYFTHPLLKQTSFHHGHSWKAKSKYSVMSTQQKTFSKGIVVFHLAQFKR